MGDASRDQPTNRPTIDYVLDEPNDAAAELDRLRKIAEIAHRVASSRRDGVVEDKGVLDLLDQALES